MHLDQLKNIPTEHLERLEQLFAAIEAELKTRKDDESKTNEQHQEEIRATKEFEGYNRKRYSQPWIAKVTSWDVGSNPTLEFGSFLGEAGDAGSVEIKAAVGTIVKYGQKDYRGNNTVNQFAVVNQDGSLSDLTAEEARELFN